MCARKVLVPPTVLFGFRRCRITKHQRMPPDIRSHLLPRTEPARKHTSVLSSSSKRRTKKRSSLTAKYLRTRTPELEQHVWREFEQQPETSTWTVSATANVSIITVWGVFRADNLRPYMRSMYTL
ncbi:hypothetical protein TNIN_439161 [Trichonephila inaurata madagascariensis]|uniref:Uncharacterized protein n=1 Tax=Trichonephila inaurata madagascariensis TaxID=2747483 RepID=A0A8X6WTG3_9ARAC|nr:hypothetical protein TNIN_439161 [Trichonephila inaurata madagascariensis]